jgi:hypothetical protein
MKLFGNRSIKSRSGAVELSINAIVIIVIAMAVLGLGLGIVRGIRSQGDKLIDFDIDISEDASSTNRITNLPEDLSLRLRDNRIGISFYNTNNVCETQGARIHINCPDIRMDEGSDEKHFSYVQVATTVPVGEPSKLLSRVTPNSNIDRDTYACIFEVVCGSGELDDDVIVVEQKPIFVTITA